ncbi:hypothetical protein GE061_006145 [Apolygus lucorum]|uniref:Uncharacterized protein n=1 Tax=Apolygus lucorum TaxID=248454 RepID=A0A6A4JBZ8_APOLU|nr:hypothetical protein GE061_006145 [Apolygus lucorum]
MPRTLEEIRRDACYNSAAQAMTKPLLTGEKCCCKNENGCFKFPPDDVGVNITPAASASKKTMWPQCEDCGENHPSPTNDLLNKDVMERSKKAKQKPIQVNRGKGECQWPNPCQADCFEDHGKNTNKKKLSGCKDETCMDKVFAGLRKTSYGAFPGI